MVDIAIKDASGIEKLLATPCTREQEILHMENIL